MTTYADYDLHLHSQWSYDATAAISDYFRLGRKRRVRALALTDHHLMDGYEELAGVAAEYPEVGYVAGAELTVHTPTGSIDMVCLGLPKQPTPELAGVFDQYRAWQCAYGSAISANLVRMGHNFTDAERLKVLRSYRPERIIARQGCTHVKNAILRQTLLERGVAADLDGLLAVLRQFRDMPTYPEYDAVLPAVRRAGGVTLIAHPYGYFRQLDRRRMDELREMLAFDGIECAHPSLTAEASDTLRAYCQEHRLLSSGGSDCHAAEGDFSRPDHVVDFACHCGKPAWLDEILERVPLLHGA